MSHGQKPTNACFIFLMLCHNIVKCCLTTCALKVVDFLNDLYTTFDSVIDMFDVYKVHSVCLRFMFFFFC